MSEHQGHVHDPNRYAVPTTTERLGAERKFNGRGVTIAFLDSGFFPHPDLTFPQDRILGFHDTEQPGRALSPDVVPAPWDWHGTQTSVVAAGNGFLSDGLYRGLAPEARVVLVRVGTEGRISEESIARGLEWVLANRERYAIRIVNISLGGDEDAPLAVNRVNQLAEEAVREGLVLIVAAGNSGCTEKPRPVPPATARSVITVGGYDERNDPDRRRLALYCSSFGFTAEGLAKPEIIAPAKAVAAPLLPRTRLYRRARTLLRLANTPCHLVQRRVTELRSEEPEIPSFEGIEPEAIRYWAQETLREEKIVATHYQQVEGTSFAAPIVSSVAAQMLEANPALTPAAVKQLFIATADRIPGAPVLRQGFGVLNARAAVEAARRERHSGMEEAFSPPRLQDGKLVFVYHDDEATRVAVAGDFNGWDPSRTSFLRERSGTWRAEVEPPPPGRYRYKLLVGGSRWVEDPSNGAKEPDPYGAFNSVVQVP